MTTNTLGGSNPVVNHKAYTQPMVSNQQVNPSVEESAQALGQALKALTYQYGEAMRAARNLSGATANTQSTPAGACCGAGSNASAWHTGYGRPSGAVPSRGSASTSAEGANAQATIKSLVRAFLSMINNILQALTGSGSSADGAINLKAGAADAPSQVYANDWQRSA